MDMMYENAKKAIQRMFSDLSVPPETTKENLKGLRDEIDLLLDALKHDGN